MAQCFHASTVNIGQCTEKLFIKSKTLRSRKYRRRKLRAKKRRLYLKRKHIARYSFQKFLMDNCKELTANTRSAVKNFAGPDGDRNWQHEEDIAYWKARAISLEYENRMLYKYIKKMYIDLIQHSEINNYNLVEEGADYVDENQYDMIENETSNDTNNYNQDKNKCEDTFAEDPFSEINLPREQVEKRNEQMEVLYGSASRKILGMETALQLQFEHTVKEKKTNYWPVIPIKL